MTCLRSTQACSCCDVRVALYSPFLELDQVGTEPVHLSLSTESVNYSTVFFSHKSQQISEQYFQLNEQASLVESICIISLLH